MSTPRFLPRVALTLKEETPFDRRDEFLRLAQIIVIIRIVSSRQCYHGRVMEIVIPKCVDAKAAGFTWANQACLLPLILGHDKRRAMWSGGPDPLGDFSENRFA